MISCQCTHCNAQYRVQSELAGKTAKCKKCQSSFVVQSLTELPTDLVAEAPVEHSVTQAELMGAIRGPIEKVPLTIQYRVSLALAAILMVMLPLIYVGIILATIYGVYYHSVHNFEPIFNGSNGSRSGSSAKGGILIYVTPIVIGVLLVIFMVKPLFARPAKSEKGRSITRPGEPKLFAFIDKLCEAVHAPVPQRIDVNCDVNASASFRRGLWSMLGNDLVLTIGMPLVSGLNVRELSGVLAHEFGHFSQGFGMRLSYIVRSINLWFTRVVYQRDEWDEAIERWSSGIDLRIGIILYLARGLIWLNRRFLWCLMMLGHIVSSYLMRQMEYDADLHECRFSGSDTFASTSSKLRRLSLAYNQSMSDQYALFLDRKLCNDLPGLTKLNFDEQTAEIQGAIQNAAAEEKTSWTSTHPCDRDRIQAAERDNAPGVFRLTDPAAVLFTHYEQTCLNVTKDYLQGMLGDEFDAKMLVDLGKVTAEKNKTEEGFQATTTIFGAPFRVVRPITLDIPALHGPVNAGAMLEQLKSTREGMARHREEYVKQTKELDQLDDLWIGVNQALTFVDLGAKLDPKQYPFPVKNFSVAKAYEEETRGKLKSLSDQMAFYETLFIQRATAAVRLLEVPQLAADVADASLLADASKSAFETLNVLQSHLKQFFVARNNFISLAPLLSLVNGKEVSSETIAKLMDLSREMCGSMRELEDDLRETAFPFEHPDGEISIGMYLVPKRPTPEEFGNVVAAGQKLVEQFQYLYVRCVGTLASACLVVEKAIGLPPIESGPPSADAANVKPS